MLLSSISSEQDNIRYFLCAFFIWNVNTFVVPLSIGVLYHRTSGLCGTKISSFYYTRVEKYLCLQSYPEDYTGSRRRQKKKHNNSVVSRICSPLRVKTHKKQKRTIQCEDDLQMASEFGVSRSQLKYTPDVVETVAMLTLSLLSELMVRCFCLCFVVFCDLNGFQSNILNIFQLDNHNHNNTTIYDHDGSLWYTLFDGSMIKGSSTSVISLVIIAGTLFQSIIVVCQSIAICRGATCCFVVVGRTRCLCMCLSRICSRCVGYPIHIRLADDPSSSESEDILYTSDTDDALCGKRPIFDCPIMSPDISPIISDDDNDNIQLYSISKPQPYPTSYPMKAASASYELHVL